MKSNVYMRKLSEAFVMLSFLAIPAFAQAQDREPDNEDDVIEELSEIGIETGLELYPRDKADTCVPGALQIRATIHNVTKVGMVKLELFGERDFLKSRGKLRRIRVPAAEGSQVVCINLPLPGEYAVVGYHDKDGDRRLKKAWNFKPKEPYGLSNNPEIKALRLPKFSETGFNVPMEGIDIDIHMVDLS